jgi:CrcB protein
MWKSLHAVAVGSALGALLRWSLGMKLNGLLPGVPPGTLLANLLGAFIIGAALAWLAGNAAVSPEWRLLITTGFCGGLTTFSTFSAEVFTLLQQGRPGWAALATAMHVGGSLLMTLAGYAAWQWLRLR